MADFSRKAGGAKKQDGRKLTNPLTAALPYEPAKFKDFDARGQTVEGIEGRRKKVRPP
jgi:hypothetical protein